MTSRLSQNILLKTSSFDGTVKITDFGLSKDIDTTDVDQSFSTTTMQAGTEIASFGYYAPEVYRREKQTAKVDIFSLGCSIFYLLSGGHRPHEDPQQPNNKLLLNHRILSGRSDLTAISHLSEAAHMIGCMIELQKDERPTVQQLLDWHCYFWSERKRFDFLCTVGNENDRKAALPPPMCTRVLGKDSSKKGWRALIDDFVFDEYTRDSNYRQHYDCNNIADLLRFMRNVSQHTRAGSVASATFESAGGMECYFLQRFPRLLLVVWDAVTKAGWGIYKHSEFQMYLPSTQSTKATASTSTGGIGGKSVLPSLPTKSAATNSEPAPAAAAAAPPPAAAAAPPPPPPATRGRVHPFRCCV